MATVAIVYTPETAAAALLEKHLNNVAILQCLETFPIADAMVPFLARLSAQFERVYIIISQDPAASIWLSKELNLQQSLGSFSNVLPVFLKDSLVPSWWRIEESKYLVLADSS